ncbi:MAG TPA: hypothetical protein VIM14_14065 [Polyangia bacterium]
MMFSSLSKALLVSLLGVLVATSAACGSNDTTTHASSFVGTWHPTSGTTTLTCAGTPSTSSVTDNLTWGAGVGADLVQTSGSCMLKANVTSSTASALPSQTCTEAAGTATVVLAVAAYTFSLSADGLTATESVSGSATVSQGGLTETCTFSGLASYQKIAN